MKEEETALNSPDKDIKGAYLSQVTYYKFMSISQALAVFLSAGMFVAANMFKYLTHSFLEGEGFMYDIWFPFDEINHDGVVILANIIMVTLGYFLNIASRLTPQTLIIFINAQLQILQIRIRKVFTNNDEEKIRLFNVKKLVEKHQKIIRFVTSLNNSIKNVIFMEFVLNSVNVAAALLRIITAKNIVEIAFSCLHLTVVLIQMVALAWSTNELNIQSVKIASAVYESNWIDQSEEIKKILYIMLMRAQKPLALTIGPFRPINVEAAAIVKINYKVCLYLKNKIPEMFFTVIEREEKILETEENDVKLIYNKQIQYYKLATFCQCFCSGFGISWFILVNLIRKYIQGYQEHFMYELWFPFNKEKNDNLVTAYNIFIAIYGFLFNCAVQTPLQTLMVFSTSQLRILQLKLRNAFARKFISEQEKIDYVKGLIKDHQFLIQFTKTLNDAVKYIILLEFALESINGAGALLQVVSVRSRIEIPYSLLYLTLLVINLSVITWSANEIIVQSCEVVNSVYESNWMDQSESIKKLLYIVMMRAQKPLSIDVGPFRPMDTQAALMGFYSRLHCDTTIHVQS
ncbi:unnamed protein product [Ceutorhynchus assimilis]|uniref:Odorant receptor n=1 Tax=Ceutorhynchus assimilis TaxID=467358 RepID=A0A9P0GJQ8_9CUCU|nr:unnamed protein product [Ceutorhynchus assimilis]